MPFEEKLRITNIVKETHDVKTFMLEKKGVNFIPGQYCIVSLADFEELKDEARPFTFACSPLQNYLQLTIKKMKLVTVAIHERLRVGDSLMVRGPYGEALRFDNSVKEDLVLIAGGSGITPFRSIIDYIIGRGLQNRVVLLFSNRTVEDIIFRKYLARIDGGRIRVVNTVTDQKPKGWDGETGRISRDMIAKYVIEPENKLYYVCGPPPMIESVKHILVGLGVDQSRSRIEDWQLPGKHQD
jgi:NAD(P)H-flavin reductase